MKLTFVFAILACLAFTCFSACLDPSDSERYDAAQSLVEDNCTPGQTSCSALCQKTLLEYFDSLCTVDVVEVEVINHVFPQCNLAKYRNEAEAMKKVKENEAKKKQEDAQKAQQAQAQASHTQPKKKCCGGVKKFLTRTLPDYLASLPIPSTLAGIADLSADDWFQLAPLLSTIIAIFLLPKFLGRKSGSSTNDIDLLKKKHEMEMQFLKQKNELETAKLKAVIDTVGADAFKAMTPEMQAKLLGGSQ